MKERVTKFITVLFISISYLVTLFPFYFVNADVTSTYFQAVANECYTDWYYNEYGSVYVEFDSDVRVIRIKNYNNNNSTVYAISLSSFKSGKSSQSNNPSCPVPNTNSSYNSSNNNIPFDFYWTALFSGVSTSNPYNVPFDIVVPDYVDSTNALYYAYYYTYGDGAVDPAPPAPIYGDLILNGYSTDIAGQGEASLGNIDHIKWDNSSDTLGNDISNLKVRLQIVPGTYYGDSKAQLLSQTYEDMIIDINNAHEQVYNVSLGEVSFNWSDIVDWLNITSYKLWSAQLFGVNWEKEGWIYRIRLEDPVYEYVGNWQTVYSSTSSGVENDLTIINSSTIDQTYITALQEVNNLNTVNNNWTVNNIEISVTNDYTEPQQGDKPWWAYLLESILNTFNITNNYIYEGDSNTQNISNTVNDSDDDMNRKIGEYQQFEDSFIDNMDDNLTDIDTNIDFLSDNKFIASANWVAQQYNRMTTNNVIGSFIGFSLLFGLALIFIGKIR